MSEEQRKDDLRRQVAFANATVAKAPVRFGEIYIDCRALESRVFAYSEGWN